MLRPVPGGSESLIHTRIYAIMNQKGGKSQNEFALIAQLLFGLVPTVGNALTRTTTTMQKSPRMLVTASSPKVGATKVAVLP